MGEYLVSAVMHGVYGGDIDKLSVRTAMDEMYAKYHAKILLQDIGPNGFICPQTERSLLADLGQDKMIRQKAKETTVSTLTFGKHGMETLPNALEQALRAQPNVRIKLGESIKEVKLDRQHHKVDVSAFHFLLREVEWLR